MCNYPRLLLVLNGLWSQTAAYQTYVRLTPNGGKVPNAPAVGHTDSTGASTNAFGEQFGAARNKWTTEVCQQDADQDGFTNGQELGDPCCVWKSTKDDSKLIVDGISHPGEKAKVPSNPLLKEKCAGEQELAQLKNKAPSTSNSTSSPESLAPMKIPSDDQDDEDEIAANSACHLARTYRLGFLSCIGVLIVFALA
uniref:Uncharacterized protein AlNc14C340G10786 n=1 Tax=Albugo laibachii Nc14 TaxID=890382 RepID=F0WX29_9STRA|nr:conserved hypothetical protein [Albugo laibachii Nc14]|eukprot:CCA26018.1 conserved hypothetical protein [Albugo laibachii Nc14]